MSLSVSYLHHSADYFIFTVNTVDLAEMNVQNSLQSRDESHRGSVRQSYRKYYAPGFNN